MTTQNFWSRYDRHFGIKGRRFIMLFRCKLNHFGVKIFTWICTYQQSVFKRYHSNRILSVLPTRWRRKTAGIDMKQNYVTVTLRILLATVDVRPTSLTMQFITVSLHVCIPHDAREASARRAGPSAITDACVD